MALEQQTVISNSMLSSMAGVMYAIRSTSRAARASRASQAFRTFLTTEGPMSTLCFALAICSRSHLQPWPHRAKNGIPPCPEGASMVMKLLIFSMPKELKSCTAYPQCLTLKTTHAENAIRLKMLRQCGAPPPCERLPQKCVAKIRNIVFSCLLLGTAKLVKLPYNKICRPGAA